MAAGLAKTSEGREHSVPLLLGQTVHPPIAIGLVAVVVVIVVGRQVNLD